MTRVRAALLGAVRTLRLTVSVQSAERIRPVEAGADVPQA